MNSALSSAFELSSPNSVIANALNKTIDILRPRIAALNPARIEFVVGTQINGTPHLGTHLTQTSAFVLAQMARRAFSIDASVGFAALDNAPCDLILDPESHHNYQITYYHKLGSAEINSIIDTHYRKLFELLADRTDVDYSIRTYTKQQAEPEFRQTFIDVMQRMDAVRWFLSPSNAAIPLRLPCPICHWAEKRAERTELISIEDHKACFRARCLDHGDYTVEITPENDGYIDLNTIFRNLVKESQLTCVSDTLYVIVKGGDWALGTQLVDLALNTLALDHSRIPLRIFTPQILNETGAKLSKSLIRRGKMPELPEASKWVIETSLWNGTIEDYADALIWITELMLSDPKHFFRSYCYTEIEKLMKYRPSHPPGYVRPRTIRIFRKYFDMIVSGGKTIEVRVGYSSMRRIKKGDRLEFMCQSDTCVTRVLRVSEYKSFDEMMAHENPAAINPTATAEEQLKEIRGIFSSEKEALGVLAIEIEKL